VIEPDVPIARADEHVRGGAALGKSLVAAGQRLFRNEFLVTLHPRHVGVAEQRDPVGSERERALGRVDDGGHGLIGQPVHQIEIDMDDAGLTQSIGGASGLPEALPAADRFLHARLEILHAEAGAIDAHIGQRGDVLARQRTWIDFDRDLGRVRDAKPRMQRGHDSHQLVRPQHCRGAAAKMEVSDGVAGEPRSDQVDLAFQQLGIGGDRRVAACDRGVAAAIEAQLGAERYMQVERNRRVDRQRREPSLTSRAVDPGAELHGRRIAGVTRQPPVQIFEPFRLHERAEPVPEKGA
jgi:hypothetical protein